MSIICEVKPTRTAFKHEATLLMNGISVEKVKICYQNRTWESFEFESVLNRLLEKSVVMLDQDKKDLKEAIKIRKF
jgi:hypothetical protein